jgi:hypothetical protein
VGVPCLLPEKCPELGTNEHTLCHSPIGRDKVRDTHMVDREPCRGAFEHLSHERQVLKGRVIVIEVQEVHKHCGTAGGPQRGSATWRNRGGRSQGEGKMGIRERGWGEGGKGPPIPRVPPRSLGLVSPLP